MKTKQLPGHARYSISDDGRVFGPRGELTPTLARGYPTISTSKPKETVYLGPMAALVFLGPPPDGEKLEYADGNPANWRLDNLLYVSPDDLAEAAKPLQWVKPGKLELEYCRILFERRKIEKLMYPPAWYYRDVPRARRIA